eukprot:m.1645838 g.1645838  ORF g.1645838 m.1645838 type:complete len:59 (-) comp68809_c0_seq1:17-193(-)
MLPFALLRNALVGLSVVFHKTRSQRENGNELSKSTFLFFERRHLDAIASRSIDTTTHT